MPKVFLSYRRADPLPNWQVKRIGKMCAECGFDEVFVDRDTGAIPHGSNYREEIEKAIRSSDVVLALIGDKWQELLDTKRDDPNDMVRLEIGLGLSLGKKVVPILLGGRMPAETDLPEPLRPFHFCNGQSFEPDTMDSLLPLLLKALVGETKVAPVGPVTTMRPEVAPNPLQDFAARARQRAEEEAQRQRRLEDRRTQWTAQFDQFQELRRNPHLTETEILEALGILCGHWELAAPDWHGDGELVADWRGDKPVLEVHYRLPRERTFELGHGVRMPFCWIPAGSFEQEGKRVTLTRAFWMAKYPVTQGEWTAVMGSNPSHFQGIGERAPVENVSWEDAQTFLKTVGHGLRLPTEAEWEYACRAGTTGDYNVDGVSLDELGWYDQNSGQTTHSVGQKRANAWGLHDMHGNVWEWCQDPYGNYRDGDVRIATGQEQALHRVARSGGWGSNASDCRSAYLGRSAPGFRSNYLGFRPVLTLASK